jgi:adenylate kinase
MRLLIIGPQGAGKGTQAVQLAEALGIPHVSTGDLFRANITGGTALGQRVQAYLDSGALVPDEVTQDHRVDGVVVLTAPDEVLVERMLARGRADDTIEAITTRLDIYRRETAPLVEHYQDRVVSVDGVGDIADVQSRIRKGLDTLEPETSTDE